MVRMLTVWVGVFVVVGAAWSADPITFDTGLDPLTPVSGVWSHSKGKALELSDNRDEQGRPFFATITMEATDNVHLSVDFEVYDGMGEVLVCPAWRDADNYVAAVWFNMNTVRLFQVRDAVETVLAERVVDDLRPPMRLGAAMAGAGLHATINGEVVLEAAALFAPSSVRALGGRSRRVAYDNVTEEPVKPWPFDRALLRPLRVLEPIGRTAFYRKESGAALKLSVENLSRQPIASVALEMTSGPFVAVERTLIDLAPGATGTFDCPIPTDQLRSDLYELTVHALPIGQKPTSARIPFSIVPRPNPERFRVMMWGGIPRQGAQALADAGFTDAFAPHVEHKFLWDNPASRRAVGSDKALQNAVENIEKAMLAGMEVCGTISPGSFLNEHASDLRRVGRDGTVTGSTAACMLLPKAQEFCRRSAIALMETYGSHPALASALINSELRGSAQPCFHAEDLAAYRAATGRDVPPEIASKRGVAHRGLRDVPENRIVPDDHPFLTYLRWYWKSGDGWNHVNRDMSVTMKAYGKPGFFAWYDPAVRVAPVYGSAAGVDMIGQWTYTYPDPIRVGMTADELRCMARGKQMIFQMVQAIWYRSQTAPKEMRTGLKNKVMADPWDDHDPDGDFITPSPAQMREAFWAAISRPVDMIGYHGLASLFPGHSGGYRHTHSDTLKALSEVHSRVLKPLGPTLRKIGARQADVGFLESFASQVFAGHCSYGWVGGSIGAFWLSTQYAGLQPEILYEETVVEKGLDRFKVLVLPDCEVLPQSVYEKIKAWQQKGGILVADTRLAPALRAHVAIDPITQSHGDGKAFKAATMAAAAEIRRALDGNYSFPVRSSNPNVVVHLREQDGVTYVFAINDAREFGDYVGPYGLVMDNGVPAQTTVSLPGTGLQVIDLVAGEAVPARTDQGRLSFEVSLQPGDGSLFALVPRLPADVIVAAPKTAKRGEATYIDVTVRGPDRQPVAGIVPLEVRVVDPAFRNAEATGFYAARRGQTRITLDLAANERTGIWGVTVTERMTGRSATRYVTVE